jgi:RsiW-degrading membrane proteinase PrsW (M82 family)
MTLYVAVSLSAFLAALLVYRYDLYNREPWYMILLAAAAGAVAMRLVAGVELFTLGFVEGDAARAAVAATHEEAARIAVVAAVAVLFRRHFDDPMDGIVYGSVVGLGMGLEESFHLLNLAREPNVLTLPVELVRLLGHLVMGGIAGFGVGLAAMRMAGSARAVARSFALALLFHFAWDYVALASPDGITFPGNRSLVAVTIMVAGFFVYGALVLLGSRLSKEVFEPSSVRSIWGWPFKASSRGRAPSSPDRSRRSPRAGASDRGSRP